MIDRPPPGTLQFFMNQVIQAAFQEMHANMVAGVPFRCEGTAALIDPKVNPLKAEALAEFLDMMKRGDVWFEPFERE